jgi:histone acetyltransferase 1
MASNPLGYRTPPNSISTSVLSSNNNDDDDNDSTTDMHIGDEPKLSSAALCTRLQLQDVIFRPEFTHQCLSGEYVRGYQPLRSVLQQVCQECDCCYDSNSSSNSNSNSRLLHKSHRHHLQATKELDILVTLAPSCRKCHVATTIQKKKRKLRQDKRKLRQGNRHVKRLKGGGGGGDEQEDDQDEEEEKTSSTSDNDNDSGFEPSSEDEDDGDDGDDNMRNPEGTTRTSRMPQSEILESISKALPEMVDDEEDVTEDYLARPIGKILQEFSVSSQKKKKNGTSSSKKSLDYYCMTLANGTDANVVAYHNQVQKLALWFIENADESNVASNSGGFWKVVYLFQKIPRKGYSLAGYVTLFHFHAPFHKPKPGIIVRICQALVLPPYQRQGHGQTLMTCVYDLAHGKYSDIYKDNDTKIVQINVEDPAPGFVALRNKVDYQLVRQHLEWFPTKPSKIGHADFFTPLTEIQAQAASALAKITPRQMHLCHELTRLQAARQQQQQGRGTRTSKAIIKKDEELEKQFRLLVKKRLNKEHREEMSALPTKAGKQEFLAKLFDKELKHYEGILRTCQ